ncbi:MAG: chitobiase/beta-hexosaminidase C-terminal domain-containing protein [Muribaculaceae bacterium]|nr:chitobiase/beta-hexosaminidase C-terminal domain-containing protein [Muribaculaceae bacterium]
MKRIYTLLAAVMVFFAAKADWTFYADVSNTNPKWTSVSVHLANTSGWWGFQLGEQIGDSDIYVFNVKDWPDLAGIAFDQGSVDMAPVGESYGIYTLDATDENQKIVNGGLYVFNPTTPGSTVTPNYVPEDYDIVSYYLGRQFTAGQGWEGDIAMTKNDGGTWTVGPMVVSMPMGANFGIRKVDKHLRQIDETWYAAASATDSITATINDYQLTENSRINVKIAPGSWTFTLDPTTMKLSVVGDASANTFWGLHATLNGGTDYSNLFLSVAENTATYKNVHFTQDGQMKVFNNLGEWYGVAAGTADVTGDATVTLTLINDTSKQSINFAPGFYNISIDLTTMIMTVTPVAAADAVVEAPVISPVSSEELTEMPEVTMTCPTDGASIYYTIGDDTATYAANTWYLYEGPFTPEGTNVTIHAIAVKGDMESSERVSANYAISIVPIYMILDNNDTHMATPATTSLTIAKLFGYNLISNNVAEFTVTSWTEGKKFLIGLLDYTTSGGEWTKFSNGGEIANGTEYTLTPYTRSTSALKAVRRAGAAYMTLPASAADHDVTLNYNIKTNALMAKWTVTPTAIDAIETDENVAPVYYNLQGVRVANPTTGFYVEVRGSQVSKVFIR